MFKERRRTGRSLPINMSAVDPGDFGAGTVREIFQGVMQEETSIIDEVAGTEYNPLKLNGTVDLDASESGVARGENQDLEPGEEAKAHQGAVDTQSFDAKAQVGQSLLRDESKAAFEAGNVDALEREIRNAVRDGNKAFDRKAFGSSGPLVSTTLNVEFDATVDGSGAWDDKGSASTPVTDIRTMKEVKAPGADAIIMGRDIKNGLMVHPDVLAELSNFSGGTADEQQLENWLKRKFGFSYVKFLDQIEHTYNSGAKGSFSLTYLFATYCWVGYRRAIAVFNPDVEEQNKLEQVRETRRRSYLTQYSRYSDVRRPIQELGCILTNGTS